MPEDEFLMLMQICDVFDLLKLEKGFVAAVKPKFAAHKLVTDDMMARVQEGVEMEEIENFVNNEHAEGLYLSLIHI